MRGYCLATHCPGGRLVLVVMAFPSLQIYLLTGNLLVLWESNVFGSLLSQMAWGPKRCQSKDSYEERTTRPLFRGVQLGQLLQQFFPSAQRTLFWTTTTATKQPSLEQVQPLGTPQVCRFGALKSKERILQARKEPVPKTTKQDTSYCVRLWNV